jgi:chromosome segregation ATPase
MARGEYAAFTEPFRDQAEALIPKIRSLEDRVEALGEKSENVLAWIGKSAQGMVLRSFLIKNQSNLERIFAAAGERFVLQGAAAGFEAAASGTDAVEDAFAEVETSPMEDAAEDGTVRETMHEIETSRGLQEAIASELALLREERRSVNGALSAEGGAARRIQNLEGTIRRIGEEKEALFRRYGSRAEDGEFDTLVTGADEGTREELRRLRESIHHNEGLIDKLQAAISLDEEKETIAKMEKAIDEYRRRIEENERTIAELTHRIGDAKGRIEELSRRL